MNLELEATSFDNERNENEAEIDSVLAACYLLARQRASTARIEAASIQPEVCQNIPSEQQAVSDDN